MAVGGPQTGTDKQNVYAISDSEDDTLEETGPGASQQPPKDAATLAAICDALQKNFVFRSIPDSLLAQVAACMVHVSFNAGETVLQQGAMPKEHDCMYVLESGEAEVVISGAVQSGKKTDEENKQVEERGMRIPQKPGWVFGDVALLFNSPRSASVVAKTNISLWALDRRTFLSFVLQHASGARTLRFVRKLPLLKGLSDNDLLRVAGRMKEAAYEDGQALIKYGERGDELYLIRYGKVRVLRPDEQRGRVEVAVLGRGQFVGERTIITGKLRSADCVAQGRVQVVVMNKRDFLDLDNPLLAWMLDYDAIATVLKSMPALQKLKQDQMEHIIDSFDSREEFVQGTTLLEQGEPIERLYIIKMGEVKLMRDGQVMNDPTFVKECAGFGYFGDSSLDSIKRSPYKVVVNSDVLHLLCLRRKQMDNFLGAVGAGLLTKETIVTALKNCKDLAALNDEELGKVVESSQQLRTRAGEVVVAANTGKYKDCMFLVKSGEALLVSPNLSLHEGEIDTNAVASSIQGRLRPGDLFNVRALLSENSSPEAHLVTAIATTLLVFKRGDVEDVLGGKLSDAIAYGSQQQSTAKANQVSTKPTIPFKELELLRIIGTGQFGMVRVVRHTKTNEVYALKVMHKAPIVEGKQIEHVINERRILGEADHPFCVRMVAAYQDKNSLYLLQEWVPGGELFHHLDLEGAFDEHTAMFFAANVLLALEFLHSKGIVYRDLKPENLLLDTQGYIKMADFGFAKNIASDKTYTICGTPDYQAPEVIMRRGTTKAADYWALGVLIFEMLVGDPPFKSLTGDPWDTFRRTLSGRFFVPNFISDAAADIIFKLLQVSPEKRLGSGRLGAEEIKRHRWFSRIDWAALEAKQIPAPIKPRVRNPLDTSNFDNFDSADEQPAPTPRAGAKEQSWDLWSWID